jgi:hypothetical protein
LAVLNARGLGSTSRDARRLLCDLLAAQIFVDDRPAPGRVLRETIVA